MCVVVYVHAAKSVFYTGISLLQMLAALKELSCCCSFYILMNIIFSFISKKNKVYGKAFLLVSLCVCVCVPRMNTGNFDFTHKTTHSHLHTPHTEEREFKSSSA